MPHDHTPFSTLHMVVAISHNLLPGPSTITTARNPPILRPESGNKYDQNLARNTFAAENPLEQWRNMIQQLYGIELKIPGANTPATR